MPPQQTHAAGTWTLGDLTVNRIGFGTKRLTNGPLADDSDRAVGVLRLAVELGVNHIDTAAFYPMHADSSAADETWANATIRSALAPYPDDLVIATKVGPGYDPSGQWHILVRPHQLREQVEQNLRELGVDHLDVVNLRQSGLESIAEHFGALAELRDAGLIRHLGLSNVRPHLLTQAREIAPVVCVQNRYGVDFGRVNDDLLRTCGDLGIAFVPFFALAGAGREVGGVVDNDAVLAIAQAHRATPAQVRIAWTLSRGPHVLAIPGTGSPDHLAENMSAATLRLSTQDITLLDSLATTD